MTRHYFEINMTKIRKKIDAQGREVMKMEKTLSEEEFEKYLDSIDQEIIELNMALAAIYLDATTEPWWGEYLEDLSQKRIKAMNKYDLKRFTYVVPEVTE